MKNGYIALDIETTGLSPETAQIIEIGAVVVVEGKETARFSKLINPGVKLPERIVELTNITDEMVAFAESERTVMREFLAFLRSFEGEMEGSDIILGHNIGFDFSFLKTAAVRMGETFDMRGIDTLKISRSVHAELPSKRLDDMCNFYGIDRECSHRAFEDALAAADLYERLKEKFAVQQPELFVPEPLSYEPKKQEPMTAKQRKYLLDLVSYHNLEVPPMLDEFTKSKASRFIDKMILEHGMPKR